MKIKTLSALSLTLALALFTARQARTLDQAKLDPFFDRLAEKNQAMRSLPISRDGNVLYARAIVSVWPGPSVASMLSKLS